MKQLKFESIIQEYENEELLPLEHKRLLAAAKQNLQNS